MFEDHTGQNIADAIVDMLDIWDLETSKLIATTTDNGAFTPEWQPVLLPSLEVVPLHSLPRGSRSVLYIRH